MVKNFTADKFPYPVISICKTCGGQRRALVVPPLAIKFDIAPPLTPAAVHASDAFENSELVVVVGFSFAEADLYISRMLSKSMQASSKQGIIIIDPDPRVAQTVRRKFKASIPGFDPTRIMRLQEDCTEAVPKLLRGELAAKASKPSKAGRAIQGL